MRACVHVCVRERLWVSKPDRVRKRGREWLFLVWLLVSINTCTSLAMASTGITDYTFCTSLDSGITHDTFCTSLDSGITDYTFCTSLVIGSSSRFRFATRNISHAVRNRARTSRRGSLRETPSGTSTPKWDRATNRGRAGGGLTARRSVHRAILPLSCQGLC